MTNNGRKHPEDIETMEYAQVHEEPGLGTQEQMLKDPQWNGIPPVGDKPIFNKRKFLLMILLVKLCENPQAFTPGMNRILFCPGK